jgi:DUF1680 family protein
MPPVPLNRRTLLQTAGVVAVASALPGLTAGTAHAEIPPPRGDIGAAAQAFPLNQVRLTPSRWMDNQSRTLAYLKAVDVNRLLYNFRANHRLSTNGAQALGGWEAPDFPFRTHSQGHFLSAWSFASAVLGDTACRDRANLMVAELAKCQANNAAAGFGTGYLSGFPESDIAALEAGNPVSVSYYSLHKTLAGLLDAWRYTDNLQARDVLLRFAGWVDWRTGRLSSQQMQNVLRTEFGGMNAVLADLCQQSGDTRWLAVAQRFDHAAVFDPLANRQDQLNGLHANTQVPKWIGAAREYKASGTTRYRDIAVNAWDITVGAHTYAIGGNSQAEHFRPPNAIAAYLTTDTAEACNTYNMLKLTRELWLLDPNRAQYFDFYERALLNHLLGQQNPASSHGHICYFTGLNPGHRRGNTGPAWGGGTWSTDYTTFWCCQGTALEVNTRLADSVYFHSGSTLTVNLFIPSALTWSQRGVTITQATSYPHSDTTTLTVGGTAGQWTLRVRVPGWTSGATISVNGTPQGIATTPGSYAALTRTWSPGDVVTVKLPMRVVVEPANDDPNVVAVTYGPAVLAGDYGNSALSALPTIDPASITRTSASTLAFTARANGSEVRLGPFHDAHGYNYTVYWRVGGGTGAGYRLLNAGTGLVLGVQNMSTADGGLAVQWNDSGTRDHIWQVVADGSAVRLRNLNSGKVLGVENMSTADNARALQWGDTGTADHRWAVLDNGDGTHRLRNGHSAKLLGILNGATTAGAQAVQTPDDGSADNRWRFVPDGVRRVQNLSTGMVLGVRDMSTADGAVVLQWGDTGTADHLWTAQPGSDGFFTLRNSHSGKLLVAENDGQADGVRLVQWGATGSPGQRWRLRYGDNGCFRIQSANGGRVVGLSGAAQGAQAVLRDDSGATSNLWRFI